MNLKCRRATAAIAKTLEALPAVSLSLPLGFGLLSKQNLVDSIPHALDSVPILVANLNDANIIS